MSTGQLCKKKFLSHYPPCPYLAKLDWCVIHDAVNIFSYRVNSDKLWTM